MGLYFNDSANVNLYKNGGKLQEPNQGFYIRNHVSEFMKEQQRMNKLLQQSLFEVSQRYEQQQYKSDSRWESVGSQLKELREMNEQHEVMENQVTNQLKKLEANHQNLVVLLEQDRVSDKQVVEHLNQLTISQEEIGKLLDSVAQANMQLDIRMEEQAEQLTSQGTSNAEVTKRLDNQEAIMEKITRQMDYFRSLLFERTNYLSEKIEQTSAYILSLLSGPDRLAAKYLTSQKNREMEKNIKE
ncbi:hypothetical protein [Oceanobacillus damuensis]|uniref:hypothetical protein n=1 Tax=Oceanobacillus damuensis TaxID=937928 RepID=UPI000829FC2C|nr:hypothetical protein [Oceanobacillus damuensis]